MVCSVRPGQVNVYICALKAIDDWDNLQEEKTIKLRFGKRTTETQYVGNFYLRETHLLRF